MRFGDTAVGQATGRSHCDAGVNAGSAGGKPGSRYRPGAARRVTYSAPTGPVPVATVPDPEGLLVLLTPAGLPGARSEPTRMRQAWPSRSNGAGVWRINSTQRE